MAAGLGFCILQGVVSALNGHDSLRMDSVRGHRWPIEVFQVAMKPAHTMTKYGIFGMRERPISSNLTLGLGLHDPHWAF
jgi:N6-adenosine-specific RNA methylase IME4